MSQQTPRVVERRRHVGAGAGWPEGQHIANDAQHMPFAFLRRHHVFDFVGEDEQANTIVITNCRQRQHGRDFGRTLGLEALARAELFGAAQVHDEQDG
jgi:hypothetical protein